jgi:hypothetical protein
MTDARFESARHGRDWLAFPRGERPRPPGVRADRVVNRVSMPTCARPRRSPGNNQHRATLRQLRPGPRGKTPGIPRNGEAHERSALGATKPDRPVEAAEKTLQPPRCTATQAHRSGGTAWGQHVAVGRSLREIEATRLVVNHRLPLARGREFWSGSLCGACLRGEPQTRGGKGVACPKWEKFVARRRKIGARPALVHASAPWPVARAPGRLPRAALGASQLDRQRCQFDGPVPPSDPDLWPILVPNSVNRACPGNSVNHMHFRLTGMTAFRDGEHDRPLLVQGLAPHGSVKLGA